MKKFFEGDNLYRTTAYLIIFYIVVKLIKGIILFFGNPLL